MKDAIISAKDTVVNVVKENPAATAAVVAAVAATAVYGKRAYQAVKAKFSK